MAESEPDVRRPIVLVVDDQQINVHLVAEVLSPHFEVAFATSGQRALAVSAARPVDLVLLDVHLPDLHGYEVCRRLRAQRDIPVVFLTASDDPALEEERRQAGAAETIHKPFDPATLLARVRAHLTPSARR